MRLEDTVHVGLIHEGRFKASSMDGLLVICLQRRGHEGEVQPKLGQRKVG